MTLLLDNRDVREVLTPQLAIEALERAYRDLAHGEAVCRPRIDIRIPTRDPDKCYQWGTMEGGSTAGYFAIRMKSDVLYERERDGVRTEEKFCGEPGRFCGLVLLFDIETGLPLALINDGHLQHERVAADSAIGTRLAAREDATTLGMLGSGGMARSHLVALAAVRSLSAVRIFSPTRAHREALARDARDTLDIEAVAVDDPRDACRGADILAACTNSAEPVIRGEWLEPGMHVISIGGRPDDAARARFDRTLRLGSSPAPVGRAELAVSDEYLGYVARPTDPRWSRRRAGRRAPVVTGRGDDVLYADVIAGRARARTTAQQITYSERGNIQGVQFFAVAGAVYDEAVKRKLGRELPTEWFLQDIRD